MTHSSVWGQGPASWFGGSEVRITRAAPELPALGSTTAAARLALQTAVIQLINVMGGRGGLGERGECGGVMREFE